MKGSGFRVKGSGFRVKGLGFRVLGFRVKGAHIGIRVSDPQHQTSRILSWYGLKTLQLYPQRVYGVYGVEGLEFVPLMFLTLGLGPNYPYLGAVFHGLGIQTQRYKP